jgi:hypothetical protein
MHVSERARYEAMARDAKATNPHDLDVADVVSLLVRAVAEERALTVEWIRRRAILSDPENGADQASYYGSLDALADDLEKTGPPR